MRLWCSIGSGRHTGMIFGENKTFSLNTSMARSPPKYNTILYWIHSILRYFCLCFMYKYTTFYNSITIGWNFVIIWNKTTTNLMFQQKEIYIHKLHGISLLWVFLKNMWSHIIKFNCLVAGPTVPPPPPPFKLSGQLTFAIKEPILACKCCNNQWNIVENIEVL